MVTEVYSKGVMDNDFRTNNFRRSKGVPTNTRGDGRGGSCCGGLCGGRDGGRGGGSGGGSSVERSGEHSVGHGQCNVIDTRVCVSTFIASCGI